MKQLEREAAIKMLLSPEAFPGLPIRNAAERKLVVWQFPAFKPFKSWASSRQRNQASSSFAG